MVASRKNRNTRKNRRTMYGGAGKRVYLGNGDIAVCDCKGAGGRRFSADNAGMGLNMGALTIPAMGKGKGKTKKAAGVKRVMTGKAASWQAEVARAFQNLRNTNPAATRANAMREAKTRRVAGTVPANLAVAAATAANVAANVVLNSGSGNAKTRKAQRNIERAEKVAAAAAAKAEKAAAAAAAKAQKQEASAAAKSAKAQAAANAKMAKEAENERAAAVRAKAEATAQAAAARLAALQAKLMGARE